MDLSSDPTLCFGPNDEKYKNIQVYTDMQLTCLYNSEAQNASCKYFDTLLEHVVGENDVFLLDFSGHGEIKNGKGFILPHDAEKNDSRTLGPPYDELYWYLKTGNSATYCLSWTVATPKYQPWQPRGRKSRSFLSVVYSSVMQRKGLMIGTGQGKKVALLQMLFWMY